MLTWHLLFGSVFFPLISPQCDIVISEFNSDDIGRGEFFEYIELMATCPSPTLRNYMIIIVKEFDDHVKSSSIVFSADFYHKTFKQQQKFFVIGSPNELMKDKIDMSFSDNAVMFYRKAQLPRQRSLNTYFTKASAPTALQDVIPNGNTSPFAAILLKTTRQDSENQLKKLRLSIRDDTTHRTKTVPHLKITDELEKIIADHLHDIVIYGRQTVINDCGFFKQLLKNEEHKSLILPAREWDRVGHEDLSLNRCPDSAADFKKKFIFSQWKLGKRTPGEQNDCTGTQWIIERALPQILSSQGIDLSDLPSTSTLGITVPAACSASTNIVGLVKSKSKNVADARDAAVEAARNKEAVCSVAQFTEEEKQDKILIDKKLDAILDILKGKKEEMKSMEPQVKARCIDTQTNNPVVQPWTDHSHFTTAMVNQIQMHQGDFFKTAWLTPARKSWLKFIFNSQDPSNSKFQCRFCSAYVKRHGMSAQHVPDLATSDGFFVKNYETMKKKIAGHAASKTHILAEDELKKKYAGEMDRCLKDWQKKAAEEASTKDIVTSRMIRTVYSETKNNIPLDTHADVVLLQKLNGLDMGSHHYERTSATRMMDCIAGRLYTQV